MTLNPNNDALGPQLKNKGGKAMDAFLEAFFALDTDNREVVSVDDLRMYSERNHLGDQFPEVFLQRFDAQESGLITLEQYCKSLGLISKEARELRRRRTTQLFEELLPPDLEIICDDMNLEMKVKLLELLISHLRKSGCKPNVDVQLLDEAMQNIIKYFEHRYGKSWHIVISINQHLVRFNYLPGTMFHFCLGRFAVLIWQTPTV